MDPEQAPDGVTYGQVTDHVAVIGAGSFGTALAAMLAQKHARVSLWARSADVAAELSERRENTVYLPGIRLPDRVSATDDLVVATRGAALVLFATPSHALRDVASAAAALIEPGAMVVSAVKGIEVDSLALMSTVLAATLGPSRALAFLSGPSFAREVADGLPTSVVIAADDEAVAKRAQDLVSLPTFRCYSSTDVAGVQIAGALKNVFAIVAGAIEGMGLGLNARAALITRGLNEMARLGIVLGAHPLTFAGLAGVGDLVLTCTGELSRNRRLGLLLGRGQTLAQATADSRMVAEGVRATKAAHALALREKLDLPIIRQAHRVLYDGLGVTEALRELMSRQLKPEWA